MAENTENIEKTAEELALEKTANTATPASETSSKKTTEADEKAKKAEKAEAKEVAKRCDVKVIYKNTKGEYFTSENLAVASESGIKAKVKTFEF